MMVTLASYESSQYWEGILTFTTGIGISPKMQRV